MANQANARQQKGWDKVVAWYARNAYAVNMIYSLGASVVIIGALFKILHWPGASYVLMAGMFTESFLFMMGIFEKPHASYHWENVFPQLIGDETKELLGGNGVNGVAAPKQGEVPAIPEAELKALKEGIQKLGDTASQLASIGKVADATTELTSKMATAGKTMDAATAGFQTEMQKAGEAAQKFAGNQDVLAAATAQLNQTYQAVLGDMQTVQQNTKAYGKGVEAVGQQLASLNSVYELQLKDIQAQSAAFKAQTEKLNGVGKTIDQLAEETAQMKAASAAALEAGKQYQAAQQKLAQQVADLNKVYGNMLNAIA